MARPAQATDGRADALFPFHTKNVDQVNQLARRLKALKGVFSVDRIRGSDARD